jgi:hypothetical protein
MAPILHVEGPKGVTYPSTVRIGRAQLACASLAALPLVRLAHQSFWYDELFTVWVARHATGQIVHQASVDGFTPPLYYLLVGGLWRLGLRSESLRLLSVLGGAVSLFFLGRLAARCGGRAAGRAAWILAGLSPFLLPLSQELRPYTMFLACALAAADVFVTWWKDPTWPRAIAWGTLLILSAAFSYLGVALLPLASAAAFASPSRRQALTVAGGAAILALALSMPGLAKGTELTSLRRAAGGVKMETRWMYPLARLTLGQGVRMPPLASPRDRQLSTASELITGSLLALALVRTLRSRDQALAIALATLAFTLAAVWAADAVTGIGVTSRYLALAFPPFVLVLALTVATSRTSRVLAGALLALQLVGVGQYLFDRDYFRDDWRGLCARLMQVAGKDTLVWGFPVHHLEVATSFYAPDLTVDGGFVGKRGDVAYFLPPGTRWDGYAPDSTLERVEDIQAEVSRRADGRRVLLVTYDDNDWHGDTRHLMESFGSRRSVQTERFPAREVLVLTTFSRE